MKYTNQTLVTSAMTLGEILVKPIREEKKSEIERYRKKFARIRVGTFNQSTAFHYANLRARYKGIKPADAIQLASAIDLNTDIFISHDKQLSKIKLPVRCMDLAAWKELKK
jgi:predicted nucleic acid-binding protein